MRKYLNYIFIHFYAASLDLNMKTENSMLNTDVKFLNK